MKPRSDIIALSVSIALLAGCGGGGGGGGGSGSSPSVSPAAATTLSSAPGETALASYLQSSHQYTLKASNGGHNYTLSVSKAPNAATGKFNGSAPAYSSVDSVTLEDNGAVLSKSSSTDYYLLNPYVPLGRVASTGSPYGIVSSSTPLPMDLQVGVSGEVDSLTYYHDSTMSSVDANETETYSVESNDATSLLLCMDSTITNVTTQGTADDLVDDAESDCYTVDAAGKAALVSITLTVNGTTLTFE
jgi:hypothetical protein